MFVAGVLIGGAIDVIAAAEGGTLLERMPSSVALRAVADPRRFLPGWLQAQRS
jgi:hypothetical protein